MKKLLGALTLGLAGLALVSCGGSSDSKDVDTSSYTVTFNSNDPHPTDDYNPTQFDALTVVSGTTIDLTAYVPTMTGYIFSTWATNESGSRKVGEEYTVTADVTLYAVWTEAYVVSFVTNTADEIASQTLASGSTVTKPTNPTKANKSANGVDILSYTFDAWYSDEDLTTEYDFTTEVTSDLTLYAGYTSERLAYGYTTTGGFRATGTVLEEASSSTLNNLSVTSGFANGGVTDFDSYVGTSAYVEVTTAEEFAAAIKNAKYSYSNAWENNDLTQTLKSEGSVHVIEIKNDLDLAYTTLSTTAKSYGTLAWWDQKKTPAKWAASGYTMSDIATNGITQIKVEGISNLLIYSKNGSKITHAGFSLLSCQNVCIRNIEMDELWQWEDASSTSASGIGDYDLFGWAYAKISFSTGIWIDHCKFGKSYDGQIDVSNGSYWSNVASGEWFRAPYGGDNGTGVSITFCEFNADSDDYYEDKLDDTTQSRYLYQMMSAIETEYQNSGTNYLYYNALRNAGFTFTQILEGIAAPQKKGFLLGDDNQVNNFYLKISFNYCDFANIEDRLFKVRGGIVTSTNCVFDSLNYYNARSEFYSGSTNLAKSAVQAVSSSWKAAMVSQAILISDGGSFLAANNHYYGIVQTNLIRNNDGDSSKGGIKLNGVYYYDTDLNATEVTSANQSSYSDAGAAISESNFSFNEYGSEAPFEMYVDDLTVLTYVMYASNYGAGTNTVMQDLFLISNYGA